MVKFNILIIVMFFWACAGNTNAQEHSETKTKELNFKPNIKVFILKNIFGNVTIEGINSKKGKLNYKRTISADDNSALEQGKKEVNLKIKEIGDTMLVYIDAPGVDFNKKHKGFDYHMDEYEPDYRFTYDISVSVPEDLEISIGTINEGDVSAKNIKGKLNAFNVNGAIDLKNVVKLSKAFTVNGSIDVEYASVPLTNCKLKTINGDVNVKCTNNLSAAINYNSMNGGFYTDFDIVQTSSKTVKEKKKRGGSTFYKLGNQPEIKIGSGDIKMSFETLNGDMIIKKKKL